MAVNANPGMLEGLLSKVRGGVARVGVVREEGPAHLGL